MKTANLHSKPASALVTSSRQTLALVDSTEVTNRLPDKLYHLQKGTLLMLQDPPIPLFPNVPPREANYPCRLQLLFPNVPPREANYPCHLQLLLFGPCLAASSKPTLNISFLEWSSCWMNMENLYNPIPDGL
jgi:hypothetical protein